MTNLDKLTWFFWLKCCFSIISTLIMCTVFIKHFINILFDLCSKSRKSVSHRNHTPATTLQYKLVSWLTMISVTLFTFCIICEGLRLYNYNSSSSINCKFNTITVLPMIEAYAISKLFMYLIFLLRLDMVYKTSSYAYNRKLLLFIAIIFCIGEITAMILFGLTFESNLVGYTNTFIICDNIYNPFGTLIPVVLDFMAAIGFIWAFLYPLRKNINIILMNDGENNEMTHKLIKIGLKVTILTTVAAISTVIMLLIGGLIEGIGSLYFGFFAFTLEVSINSICIILMTPYYSNHKYYDKICFGMIKCCNIFGINDKINDNKPTDTEKSETVIALKDDSK